MKRRPTQIVAVIVLLIGAKMLFNVVWSPADAVRAELAAELAQVPSRAPLSGAGDHDFAAYFKPVLTKPNLWHEIVAAPPPPPKPEVKPAPPKAPNAPDLKEKLQGLGMQPGQIGKNKMKVVTPNAPEGAWMAVGDAYNGCILESFTREEAVFVFHWEEGRKDLRVTVPRPLR